MDYAQRRQKFLIKQGYSFNCIEEEKMMSYVESAKNYKYKMHSQEEQDDWLSYILATVHKPNELNVINAQNNQRRALLNNNRDDSDDDFDVDLEERNPNYEGQIYFETRR